MIVFLSPMEPVNNDGTQRFQVSIRSVFTPSYTLETHIGDSACDVEDLALASCEMHGWPTVDYAIATQTVSGTVDLTIEELLDTTRQLFPLLLSRKLIGSGRLADVRYEITDGRIGMIGISVTGTLRP